MIEAERKLLAYAYLDPDNSFFALLSERFRPHLLYRFPLPLLTALAPSCAPRAGCSFLLFMLRTLFAVHIPSVYPFMRCIRAAAYPCGLLST